MQNDDETRAFKAKILREAAEDFRHLAAGGTDAETNHVAADLLEGRANRIAGGAPDHSTIVISPEDEG